MLYHSAKIHDTTEYLNAVLVLNRICYLLSLIFSTLRSFARQTVNGSTEILYFSVSVAYDVLPLRLENLPRHQKDYM